MSKVTPGLFILICCLFAGCAEPDDGTSLPQSTSDSSVAAPLPDNADDMVDALISARGSLDPIPPLTETYGPLTKDEAYAVQDLLAGRLEKTLGRRSGYKIGFARPTDTDGPASGPVFANQLVESGDTIAIADFNLFHIENEVVFKVGKRIDQPVESVEELRPYVESVHAGFDIADTVYDPPTGQTIPDFIANAAGEKYYVVGPAHDPDSVDVDGLLLKLYRKGQKVYEGPATEVMNSPWNVMLWLANDLLRRDHVMEAGDIVLTGKVAPAVKLAGEDALGTYLGEAGELGEITITVR